VSLPVLFVVDEDADALGEVAAHLVRRYGRDYRVEFVGDAGEAVRALSALAEEGEEVALVLAGTSLPQPASNRLLGQVRRLHPHAKRALLAPADAWGDELTLDAVRDAMALGRVDYYVLRPAGAGDEVFHDVIASFLLEWARDRRLVPQTVHIVGESWSGRAYELREIFEQCVVPHEFSLADSQKGRELLARAGDDARLPLMVFPDGRCVADPSDAEIAEAAGAPARLDERDFDVVIVGAGPAGLSAAVYGASEGLRVLVVDSGGIGGQARTSSLIRNYLGFPKGVSGSRLAEQSYEQALVFGASFLFMHRAVALEPGGDRLSVTLVDGRRISARAVILSTGASYRRLDVPSLEAFHGSGVFYGSAVTEAPSLTGKAAYIAGGGNSAGQAALHLARYAREVTLVVRGDSLETSMSSYLIRALEGAPNVRVRTGTTIVDGGGEGTLAHLTLSDTASGERTAVDVDALFVLIGAHPHTDWLPAGIARDEHGFVLTGTDVPAGTWPLERAPHLLETSLPSVLAVGDARHGSVKRVASAVGEGAVAVQLLHSLLADDPDTSAPGASDAAAVTSAGR
jgi:thioredoxin reductase (NADPH)